VRKTLVIAAREYNAAVRTKSFVIGLLIMPIMMAGSIVFQILMKDNVDIKEKKFAIVDRSPGESLWSPIEAAAKFRNEKTIFDKESGKQVRPAFSVERIPPSSADPEAIARQRLELSNRIEQEDLFGFLEIGTDVFAWQPIVNDKEQDPSFAPRRDEDTFRYQSNSPTYNDFEQWIVGELNSAVIERRLDTVNQTPAADVRGMLKRVDFQQKGLTRQDAKTGKIEDARDESDIASILAPGGLMILMFMMVLMGSTPLMQSVVEEKLQRIAEVLLGSVTPFELMMGKLLGMAAVSLTLAGVYLAGAWWAASEYGFDQFFSTSTLLWFVVYLFLAVMMFGSMFIAVGAACTDMRETQTMVWPVMLIAMLPMFVWVNVVKEPSSGFSTVASFIPTATPMLMIVRQAVPPGIPAWQPVAGVVMCLLFTVFCVWVAGRIFRVGILMQGKGANVKELFRWVFQR